MTRQKEPVIIFTPSISGIWGTSLVFHIYPHSALFHLPAAIFASSHSNRAECRIAGWCKQREMRWDNGVWPCFPLRRWIVCISAVYHCHLNLAFLAYSWHLKPSTLINIYPSSAVGWSTELGLAWTVNTATWEGQWIPVSPGMSLGSWHWPLSAHLQRLLPDFKAELQVISGTWQKQKLQAAVVNRTWYKHCQLS